ncbi:AAA family ATPase [Methylomonas sp. LL1]|uniref:AAA family ATPase n=1 Tax=Methylomonas sp. LL1 TaxID=2785785 RepID=UPI0018C4465B|nr:AAA family ATPase [Methylomonas sp. LL1]QPK62893.1 AAA family ATPase [Methylomonas sp. LL1]
MTLKDTLRSHALSHYPILYVVTHDDAEVDKLIADIDDSRKIIEWNMARGLVHFVNKQSMMEWCDLATALDNLLDQELANHFIVIRDAHMGLRNQPLAIARLKALVSKMLEDDDMQVTVFLVSSESYVPRELEKFITLFDLPLPDETAIRQIISEYADAYEVEVTEEAYGKLALAFQGLSRYEIGQLINRGYQQDGMIGIEDVDLVQNEKSQIIKKSGLLEVLTVSEKLEDIGGLEKLKPWLRQKAQIFADWPAARSFGVEPPKGVMIVGMPGCGKSLTAKATATLFDLPLLKMDMGSLMGKYVGESEANMRRAIHVAEAVSPCVLWVDEVEKAFVGIGSGSSGSEVATRLFGFFLTWMQEKTKQVFVIATANDISCLPPELLRKGRFDEIFYVDFPNEQERNAIFKVHLNKRKKLKLGSRIQLDQLARSTDGYSGADIESVIKEGIEKAFVDGRVELDTDRLLNVINATQPLSQVMKSKIEEQKALLEKMKIKPAS